MYSQLLANGGCVGGESVAAVRDLFWTHSNSWCWLWNRQNA